MKKEIPEADWKALNGIRANILNNACLRALHKIDRIIKGNNEQPHQSFLQIWDVIHDQNEIIGRCFDDLRRSNATLKMAEMLRSRLMTSADLEVFTPKTKEHILAIAGANKAVHQTGPHLPATKVAAGDR